MFVLLLISSCTSKKEISKTEVVVDINPKLVFLNYMLLENENGKKTIDLVNQTVVDGKARNHVNGASKANTIGDLKCSQVDKDSQILRSTFIKNPLNKRIEFIDDSLEFKSKSVILKKAPLSLRLQLHSKAEQIIISEIIDTLNNTKPLLVTKLEVR